MILRRTFPELREVMDRALLVFPSIGGKWIASEKRFIWPSGAKVEFGYCESFADVGQYQGQEFQYIGFDEMGNLADESVWDFLLTCVRSKDPTIVKMARASANPGGAGHGWIKRRFITPCPPDGTPVLTKHGRTRAFVQAKIWDNPSLALNDPEYVQTLQDLPEVMRRQHLEGDWDVGSGLAFEGLTEVSHLVERAAEPWWTYFASFDWGFGHKWVFCLFANLPGGRVRLVDSATGRRQIPEAIVERVKETLRQHGLGFTGLQYTVAGSDVKIRDEARGAFGPSVSEQFGTYGWYLMNADNSRIAGYSNLLQYLQLREGESALEINPTPTNKAGIRQLMEMVVDPDSPNDVLKVDVNPLSGEGGDDFYDSLRYGLMSRPIATVVPRLIHHDPHRSTKTLEEMIGKKQSPKGWGYSHPRSLPNRRNPV